VLGIVVSDRQPLGNAWHAHHLAIREISSKVLS
jgi:hypothetical protein